MMLTTHANSMSLPSISNSLDSTTKIMQKSVLQLKIFCNYLEDFRTHIELVYACKVKNEIFDILEDDTFVTELHYKIMNYRVKHFAIDGKNCFFMPQGLEIVFAGKLKGLEITESIKFLRMKDMQSFHELGYLNLRGNHIECIERDVFRYNKKLV
jgi:hypothetical protein